MAQANILSEIHIAGHGKLNSPLKRISRIEILKLTRMSA